MTGVTAIASKKRETYMDHICGTSSERIEKIGSRLLDNFSGKNNRDMRWHVSNYRFIWRVKLYMVKMRMGMRMMGMFRLAWAAFEWAFLTRSLTPIASHSIVLNAIYV